MGSASVRKLLLDTHVWVWQLLGSDALPHGMRKLLQSAEVSLWISPISVWEVLMLGERGRLDLTPDAVTWVKTALKRSPCAEAPLTTEVAFASRQVALDHQDPADRFIVATALVYGLELVTCDGRLSRVRGLKVVSR